MQIIDRSTTYPQGWIVTPRAPMEFVNPETKRKTRALPGQKFWITNTQLEQRKYGFIRINREGKGHISTGPAFSLGTFNEWFVSVKELES